MSVEWVEERRVVRLAVSGIAGLLEATLKVSEAVVEVCYDQSVMCEGEGAEREKGGEMERDGGGEGVVRNVERVWVGM